jgi:hypothetical protein
VSLGSCSHLHCAVDVSADVRKTGWPHVGGLHIHKAPTVMGREIEARQRETESVCVYGRKRRTETADKPHRRI